MSDSPRDPRTPTRPDPVPDPVTAFKALVDCTRARDFRGATEKESDLSSRLHADLEYLAGWSIWRDIRIILSTFRVLVHDRAY